MTRCALQGASAHACVSTPLSKAMKSAGDHGRSESTETFARAQPQAPAHESAYPSSPPPFAAKVMMTLASDW